MFHIVDENVLRDFIMEKLNYNKELYYEFKKKFTETYCPAMFYSLILNNSLLLEDMYIDMATGNFYLQNNHYDIK